MYVGLGTLSEAQKTEISAMLPRWYSREFVDCWNKETNPDYPHCRDLNTIYGKLDEKDQAEMNKLIENSVPVLSEKQVLTYGLMIAGASLAVGLLVATAMR